MLANKWKAFLAFVYLLVIQCIAVTSFVAWYSNVTIKEVGKHRHITHTSWPSQQSYSSLHILNLNDYIKLFEHCLINIENYQGIDVSETLIPVLMTRLDTQITRCNLSDSFYQILTEIYFGMSVQEYCKFKEWVGMGLGAWYDMHNKLPLEYKLTVGRWSCYAKFELLLPEIKEAPHIFDLKRTYGNKEFFMPYNNFYEDAEPGEL